jgi:hypothetical protein
MMLGALLLLAPVAHAAPLILTAAINSGAQTITITGQNLQPIFGLPVVAVAGVKLIIVSNNATQITAKLPPPLPESLLLTVTVNGVTTSFEITAGSVGPCGPLGPAGPTGPAGPVGPPGPAGSISLPFSGTVASYPSTAFSVVNTSYSAIYGQAANGGVGVEGIGGNNGGSSNGGIAGIGVYGIGGSGTTGGSGVLASGGGGAAGGSGVSASGGVGTGGGGGAGVQAAGGADPVSPSGPGVYAVGGGNVNTGPSNFGGSGVNAWGGFGTFQGGDGVDAMGGQSDVGGQPGSGLTAIGGTAIGSTSAGNGVVAFGGTGDSPFGSVGAAGVLAVGGSPALAENPGADGIDAFGSLGIPDFAVTPPNGVGIFAACAGYPSPCTSPSGSFVGDVTIQGNLSKSGGSFLIDHPLDPANKYLYHSFVESPDMKNIYDGNVITDGGGNATVTLPDWFEALNRDYRYQLTTIGQPAHAWIATEIVNNRFVIRTDRPNVKVSWMVTGIRQDAWANAHRIPLEVEKNKTDQGHYLSPELFGHPDQASIAQVHRPLPKVIERQQQQQKQPR